MSEFAYSSHRGGGVAILAAKIGGRDAHPTQSRLSKHVRHEAFTLVEVVVALVVASVMLVAALNTVGAARNTDYKVSERARALGLAQSLMSEILRQPYADPVYGPGSLGTTADELTGNRSLFNDVDDYDGWQASPPQRKDGSPIASAAGFQESVTVNWVVPAVMFQTSSSETGAKKIEVRISWLKRTIITLVAYRTEDWVDPTVVAGAGP